MEVKEDSIKRAIHHSIDLLPLHVELHIPGIYKFRTKLDQSTPIFSKAVGTTTLVDA